MNTWYTLFTWHYTADVIRRVLFTHTHTHHTLQPSLQDCWQLGCWSAGWPRSTTLSRLAGNLRCGGHGKPTVLWCNGLVLDAWPCISHELREPLVFLVRCSSGPCLVRHRMTRKRRNQRVVPASGQCRPQLDVLQPDKVVDVLHATAYRQLPPVCLQLQKVVRGFSVVVCPVSRDPTVGRQDLHNLKKHRHMHVKNWHHSTVPNAASVCVHEVVWPVRPTVIITAVYCQLGTALLCSTEIYNVLSFFILSYFGFLGRHYCYYSTAVLTVQWPMQMRSWQRHVIVIARKYSKYQTLSDKV